MERGAMTLSRRKFSTEFKLRAVRQVEVGASVADNYNGWVLPPLVICVEWVPAAAPRMSYHRRSDLRWGKSSTRDLQ